MFVDFKLLDVAGIPGGTTNPGGDGNSTGGLYFGKIFAYAVI